jgi:hypothetical protein
MRVPLGGERRRRSHFLLFPFSPNISSPLFSNSPVREPRLTYGIVPPSSLSCQTFVESRGAIMLPYDGDDAG